MIIKQKLYASDRAVMDYDPKNPPHAVIAAAECAVSRSLASPISRLVAFDAELKESGNICHC